MFSLEHLRAIREAEIEMFVPTFRPGARILEIGAGTGQQALALTQRGFEVVAVEMSNSNYKESRVFPVIEYDGRHIPVDDASIDIVFSSNVLEHVPDLHQMNGEILRVLSPGGYCIHIMPTHSWRFWTTVSAFPDALLHAATLRSKLVPRNSLREMLHGWWGVAKHLSRPLRQRRHGERGDLISEMWLFRPAWWRKAFKAHGFEIVRDFPMGHFYTGNMVAGSRISMASRAKLAKVLGSACHLFQVRPLQHQLGVQDQIEMPKVALGSSADLPNRSEPWQPPDRPPASWGYTAVEESVLSDAARRFDVALAGGRAYGFARKSAGAVVSTCEGTTLWLRISGLIGSRHDGRREAETESQAIDTVPKPKILRTLEWVENDIFWRASLMTLAPSPIVSPYSWLVAGQLGPDDDWFTSLRAALDQIKRANTRRTIISSEQIKAGIVSIFGSAVKTLAPDWCVAHGDLHWSNVTAPDLMILDWENWGWAPRGYDAARLIAYAGLVPSVQAKLMRLFAEDLETPSGTISLLLAIAMVKHDIVAGHADPSLTESLNRLAKTVGR